MVAEAKARPTYRAYGALSELFRCNADEALLEGPANTGKTRGLLEKADFLCRSFPGLRVLFVRQTRKSMSESVLVTYEEHVLGEGHPAIVGDASRENRVAYTYPNGSHVVLGGMDNPDRIMSTEYDLICFFEGTEGTVDGWEKLTTRTRNKRIRIMPGLGRPFDLVSVDEFPPVPGEKPEFFGQAVADVNPGGAGHWLNKRAHRGGMVRIMARHCDNPIFTAGDQRKLDRLTGARRKRLRDGLWSTEEGLIFDSFDPSLHIIDRIPVGTHIKWRIGAVDWGMTAAGVLQIWGVSDNETIFLEAEVYRSGRTLDWWADIAKRYVDKYEPTVIVADPSEPGNIAKFNDMLGTRRICRKADNDFIPGINIVEQKFRENRIFLLRDSLKEGLDMELHDRDKPTSFARELEEYVWFKNDEGKPIKEKPDPGCADHAADCARYAAMFVWRKDYSKPEERKTFAYGTAGYILGHDEVRHPRRPARTVEEILHG